jgi:hypothetical protein
LLFLYILFTRRIRCGGNVTLIREKVYTKFLYESLEESEHLEDLGEDTRIILKWSGGCGLNSSGSV